LGLTKKREVWKRPHPQWIAVAKEMIKLLASIKVKGNHRAIENVYKAIKAAWQMKDLEELQKRLGRIYQQMHHEIIE
jgi:hypothetical protein